VRVSQKELDIADYLVLGANNAKELFAESEAGGPLSKLREFLNNTPCFAASLAAKCANDLERLKVQLSAFKVSPPTPGYGR
jgi:hypothetical protein